MVLDDTAHDTEDRRATNDAGLDERLVTLDQAAELTVCGSGILRNEVRGSEGQILYGILSEADEAQSIPPVMRARLLSHPLTVSLYEQFEPSPARRLALLLGALQPHDEERAKYAVELAPFNPERALTAIAEYVRAYPENDHYFPGCLVGCAEAKAWEAFAAIWPTVAARAVSRHTSEIIADLTIENSPPLSRFATTFSEAVWRSIGGGRMSNIADLCRTTFEGDEQVWTLWLALPVAPPELVAAIDLTQLSPRLRACPWPSPKLQDASGK